MNARPAVALLLLPLLAAGCAATPTPARSSSMTTLYFGLSRPDGTLVAPADWQAFVDTEIVRRFPEGFTILAGDGAWDSRGKTLHEPCRVVLIVRPDTAAVDAAVDALRAVYCQRFGQESVLRVDQAARRVAF